MRLQEGWLQDRIVEFIAELQVCLTETTYSQDRSVFAFDIATAALWLVKLQQGVNTREIARTILSPETAKHFHEYWRNGEWGQRESAALEALRSDVRSRLL